MFSMTCQMLEKCCDLPVDAELLRRAQIVLFWRNRIAIGLTFAVVEALFVLVYKLNLDFVATFFLVQILYKVLGLLRPIIGPVIDRMAFPEISGDEPGQPNRIRSPEEVSEILRSFCEWINNLFIWVKEYTENPTGDRHARFLGVMFIVSWVANALGSFWCCFALVHVVLILPGLWCSQIVGNLAEMKVKTD